jgi:hypothetical protein
MTLEDWLARGWLTRHRASREEIRRLLAVADRDLKQTAAEGLDADWRLAIAYNAALQCATAALAAAGHRATREAHHYRVIQSLAFTLGWSQDDVRLLDTFRTKRHTAGYEQAGVVSDQEAQEMQRLAQRLREELDDWLSAHHPELR